MNWSSIKIFTFYYGVWCFSTLWILCTSSNAIFILQVIRKFPGFIVRTFQIFVGKVSISVGRMFVLVVFVKEVLQWILLTFMNHQKIHFIKFCLIKFLFQVKNRSLISFLCLDTSVVTDVVDILTLWCFNKIIGYFIYPYPQSMMMLSIFIIC